MTRRIPLFAVLALSACGPANNNGTEDMSMVAKDVTLPTPDHGFQLATDVVEIPSGQEWQACYFYKVPDLNGGQPFYVSKIDLAQNVGSHHLNVFRQNTIVNLKGPNADGTGVVISTNGTGECFKSPNWADWPLVVNSQIPSLDAQGNTVPYTLDLSKGVKQGDNVAYKFTPGEILMLQSHFVNASTQKTPGHAKAVVNFNQQMNVANIQEVGTLFATKQSISICKDNPTPSFTGFCKMKSAAPLTIIAANGHFHSRGKDFKMNLWDGMSTDPTAGKQFYESTMWDEPPMMTGLNMDPPAAGGVSWTCSYQWQPSPSCADGCSCLIPPKPNAPMGTCCYGFGGVVETSEHCNAFVYYYPKLTNASDITCM